MYVCLYVDSTELPCFKCCVMHTFSDHILGNLLLLAFPITSVLLVVLLVDKPTM